MLHVSGTTGTFLILDEPGQGKSMPALYFRDYDPETYSADNSDLFQVMGPAEYPGDTRFLWTAFGITACH